MLVMAFFVVADMNMFASLCVYEKSQVLCYIVNRDLSLLYGHFTSYQDNQLVVKLHGKRERRWKMETQTLKTPPWKPPKTKWADIILSA